MRIGQFNNYFQNAIGLYSPQAYTDPEENKRLFAPVEQQRKLNPQKKWKVRADPAIEGLSNRKGQLYFFIRPK